MVFSIFFIPLFFHPAVCEGLWAWPACSSAMRGGHYYWGSCAVDEPCRTHTVRSNLQLCMFQPGMVVLGLAWTHMGLSRLYHKALGKFGLRLICLKWHNHCFLGSWLKASGTHIFSCSPPRGCPFSGLAPLSCLLVPRHSACNFPFLSSLLYKSKLFQGFGLCEMKPGNGCFWLCYRPL